jgi:hypothetical protein
MDFQYNLEVINSIGAILISVSGLIFVIGYVFKFLRG